MLKGSERGAVINDVNVSEIRLLILCIVSGSKLEGKVRLKHHAKEKVMKAKFELTKQ